MALAVLRCILALPLVAAESPESCAPGTHRHPTFPPFHLEPSHVAAWFRQTLPQLPVAPLEAWHEASALDYVKARRSGLVTCEEYVRSLIQRAKQLRSMNQFMNWDNDPSWSDRVLEAARRLDRKAQEEGVEAIAPLYGLPVPMKGTMATKDFISSAGVGILHGLRAKEDAEFVKLVKAKHGIVFGKTNVPELAASLVTCNYADGCTLNPHGRLLSAGGSSGGAGSAVASRLAPLAVTEDTGGSTRSPAFSNGVFGYDPTRGHYPNAGNPGMSLILDQLGLNARSVEDIIFFDAAVSGYDPASVRRKPISQLRIGVPRYPFVEAYVPEGGDNPFDYAEYPMAWMPSREIMQKYEQAMEVLEAAGAQIVRAEWPKEQGQNVLAKAFFLTRMGSEVLSPYLHVFHPYMGMVSQWLHDYLDSSFSIQDILKDVHSAGLGHTPGRFMQMKTDESKHNFILQELRELGLAAWNRLFDEEDLDLILVPGFLHTPSYDCMADSTCKHQVKNMSSGEVWSSAEFTSLNQIFMHSLSMKHVPLPKMMVPVGLDDQGQPVGLQLMARGRFIHEALNAVDAEFLQDVQVAVSALEKDQRLRRAEPQAVLSQ